MVGWIQPGNDRGKLPRKEKRVAHNRQMLQVGQAATREDPGFLWTTLAVVHHETDSSTFRSTGFFCSIHVEDREVFSWSNRCVRHEGSQHVSDRQTMPQSPMSHWNSILALKSSNLLRDWTFGSRTLGKGGRRARDRSLLYTSGLVAVAIGVVIVIVPQYFHRPQQRESRKKAQKNCLFAAF